MKNLLRVSLLGMLTLTLMACGKSSDEKAQDDAQKLMDEDRQLVTYLENNSVDSSSSDAEINAFEAKVNRLVTVQQRLLSYNGSHGITVTKGNLEDSLILVGQGEVAAARGERADAAPGLQNMRKLKELADNQTRLTRKYENEGVPTAGWSKKKLDAYLKLNQEISSSIDQQLAILRADATINAATADLQTKAEQQKNQLAEDRIGILDLIKNG